MSYPRDLDDYSDDELHAEIGRRLVARAKGKCDYCGRSRNLKACRYRERHKARPNTYVKIEPTP